MRYLIAIQGMILIVAGLLGYDNPSRSLLVVSLGVVALGISQILANQESSQ